VTFSVPPDVQRAEALEAQELRLLAHAVGDHLPYELALRVQALRAERAALATGSPPPAADVWQAPLC
jgi:hypothetical protein